ncbi:MAG: flavin reductase family protein [Planctomycetota bacterium]
MQIDPRALDRKTAYLWLTSSLVPRPIAWMTTLGAEGVLNLAPFSFFGGVTSDPMTVMVSIGRRPDGSHKDTARNLLASSEGVVHIPTHDEAEIMVASSAALAPDASEVEALGLATAPSMEVGVPRLADAQLALEARAVRHLEVGRGPVDVFFLEIVRIHAADDIVVNGLPDPARLGAVGRLGGSGYCDTRVPFSVERPRT